MMLFCTIRERFADSPLTYSEVHALLSPLRPLSLGNDAKVQDPSYVFGGLALNGAKMHQFVEISAIS